MAFFHPFGSSIYMSDGRSVLLTLVVVECECIFLLDGFIIIRGERRVVKGVVTFLMGANLILCR